MSDWPTLAELRSIIIRRRVIAFGGNKSAAARTLGITLQTLYRYLHKDGACARGVVRHYDWGRYVDKCKFQEPEL